MKNESLQVSYKKYKLNRMTSIKADQITFPIENIQATFKVHGIYAIPDEWKSTDEANPGLFTYTVRMSKFQIVKGKICPRQLTEKQKKEQEEKSKKGGKKDSKNPQPNQEQERIKKIEEERQRQRQQLFAKLSQQQQFYHTAEDIYRSPFLKFQQNVAATSFKGNDCLIFQQRLLQNKGDWIYIYKIPTASEEELAKMRKSKPKTLTNINDLNPVIMRAWVSFDELSNSSESVQIKQLRCKIHQVDKTPETPQPKLQRAYIKVTFSLQQPIIKQKDSYSTASLIKDPQRAREKSAQQKAEQELRQQLGLAIQSLAMQFSTMFWKEINMQEEQRHSQVFLNNKKGELTKRKEQFLYDFNVTGKYKILKDRIKKCIVHLCQTKYKQFFSGMKSFNGIKCNSQDQIYSEIYNVLVASYQDTLFKIIHEKEQSLGEILILNNETIKLARQNILNSYKEETVVQRVKRTIKEYELVEDNLYGQQVIRKYIQEYPEITELKYFYGTYCLKFNLKPAKEVLPFIEEYLIKQKLTLTDDKKIQFMLILLNIGGENYAKGWIILREIIENQISMNKTKPTSSLSRWLILASVILKNMDNQSLAVKYRAFALREYQKFLASKSTDSKEGSHLSEVNHKQTPSKSEIPSIHSVANYAEVGSSEDLNKLYDSLIEFLGNYSTFELIKRILSEKPTAQVNKQDVSLEKALPQINQLLVSHSPQSRDKLMEITLKLYQQASSSGTSQEKKKILELVIRAYLLQIQSNKNIEHLKALEGYLKKSLMTNSDPLSRFSTLLRLGYVYCQKEEFGNARACLLKYLEKSVQYPSYISGLSYKLLGISCLKLQRINEAVQNFKHWNLSDIKNRDSWLYLSLAFAHSHQLITVNQCLTQYKKRCLDEPNTLEETQLLSEINEIISHTNQQGQYEGVLKTKIRQVLV